MNLVALLSGLLFGIGLAVSGMTDPAKVIGFLDITGAWNPQLAWVMGGALLVTLPAFHWILRAGKPWRAPAFVLPTRQDLDRPLILGSLLFGIGWGLAGYCPGPAIASLALHPGSAGAFVLAMAAGMILHRRLHAS